MSYHMNMESLRQCQPEKATLIDEIVGERLHGYAKPVFNFTIGVLYTGCHSITLHYESDSKIYLWRDYQYDRLKIINSCESGSLAPIKLIEAKGKWGEKTFKAPYICWCSLSYAEDIPINFLKRFYRDKGNLGYNEWFIKKVLELRDRIDQKEEYKTLQKASAAHEEEYLILQKENTELKTKLNSISAILK